MRSKFSSGILLTKSKIFLKVLNTIHKDNKERDRYKKVQRTFKFSPEDRLSNLFKRRLCLI